MPHRELVRRDRNLRRRGWLNAPLLGLLIASLAASARGEAPSDPEAARPRPVFLVTDILVGEGVDIEPEAARDLLAARFGRLRDKLEVRSLREVKSTLDYEGLAALLGKEDTDLSKVADYVDVDRLVFGRIHQVGGVTEVSVRVFNVREQAMEIALSRRLGKDKDPSLLLPLVDRLADQLLVWALNTYGDTSPSEEYQALKQKRVRMRSPKPEEGAPGRFSLLGMSGAVLGGVGLGVAAASGGLLLLVPEDAIAVPAVLVGAGGVTAAVGGGMLLLDGLE